MIYLISDSQIAGKITMQDGSEEKLEQEEKREERLHAMTPPGFSPIEGPDAPLDAIYFDGDRIQFKPEKPGDSYGWDAQSHQWVNFAEQPAVNDGPDWNGLDQAFGPESETYQGFVSVVAEAGFMAQNAWNDFKDAIARIHLRRTAILAKRLDGLTGKVVQAGLTFAPADISDWNQLMDEFRFPEECKIIVE